MPESDGGEYNFAEPAEGSGPEMSGTGTETGETQSRGTIAGRDRNKAGTCMFSFKSSSWGHLRTEVTTEY